MDSKLLSKVPMVTHIFCRICRLNVAKRRNGKLPSFVIILEVSNSIPSRIIQILILFFIFANKLFIFDWTKFRENVAFVKYLTNIIIFVIRQANDFRRITVFVKSNSGNVALCTMVRFNKIFLYLKQSYEPYIYWCVQISMVR